MKSSGSVKRQYSPGQPSGKRIYDGLCAESAADVTRAMSAMEMRASPAELALLSLSAGAAATAVVVLDARCVSGTHASNALTKRSGSASMKMAPLL